MTMYRYMAFMWSRSDPEASAAARFLAAKLHEVSPHAWTRAWDGAGLAIYHAGEHKGRMQTYRLQGERGAILGRLFRNDYTSVVDDLDNFESRKCLETRGQRLIDNYWGRYVAFLNDPVTGTRYVMRDPTGAFPCYYTEFRGVTIYFSDMRDVSNFHFLQFTVNWDYVKASIIQHISQKTITALKEVGEVLPAERLEITLSEKGSRFVWNPAEISEAEIIEDPAEAAEFLRHTVKSTIGALGACYDRVILYLGGLDSSIVLACLAEAPKRPEITCYTEFTKSPRGEERRYSRQVAEKYGVPLVECELDYHKVHLERLSFYNKCVNPIHMVESMDMTGGVLELADKHRAQAFFTGVGGDNVFHQSPTNTGALDYVRRHGLFSKSALKVAFEASRRSSKTILTTLCEMAREQFAPETCNSYIHRLKQQDLKMPFVNTASVNYDGHDRLLHPLLRPGDDDLKGKYRQIVACTMQCRGYYDCWDLEYRGERIHAFLTQPIVEACLRIPIWVMTYGGVERGLVRKAFWDDLPRSVACRYSKSTPDEFIRDIFENSKNVLLDIFHNSSLVSENFLLRDKLECALTGNHCNTAIHHGELLKYAAIEVWIKGWLDRTNTQAHL